MDKQKELLAAALRLFVEFGFHGTPTSKIAKEAGVANGTLFHYFKTKDELIVALYVDIKIRMSQYINQNMDESADIKGKLRSIYLNIMHWAMENRREFYFIRQFHTSPFLSKIAPEEIQAQAKVHMQMIESGIEQKTIKSLPVDFIYSLIMSHIFGIYEYVAAGEFKAGQQKKLIEEGFDLIWDMLS